MRVQHELTSPYPDVWLEQLRSLPKCDWCGEDHKRLQGGLCDACKRTQKALATAKKHLDEEGPSATNHEHFKLRHEFEVLQKAEDLVKPADMHET